MTLLGLALAYAGFLALSLAMERHHEQVLAHRRIPARRRQLLFWGGWLLLAASMLPPVAAFGWGLGLVAWTGLLTAAAMPLALLLCYAPRVALFLGAAPLPAGLLALL
ncbi:DUF3325 domain-containing protein [Roseomonas sp. 18066]|uniref:DUF3325 domain-containing protein n=1 Tax=Roseomonas sp. 18066 TaxID=2681412 RepID=UPI001358C19C|nr:DUF3325 domain-containing protein [Roseomonas sp. 18066]